MALACAAAAAAIVTGVAVSEPTRSQAFFRDRLIADKATSGAVRAALRDGSAFVDRSIAFTELTRDGRDDAVVRVQSGGAAGAVAVYVFSTDGGRELRAVHRAQRLARASTSVRDGVLAYRTAAYAPGEELCCPGKLVERVLRWDDRRSRFAVAERRELPGPEAP